MSPLIGAIMTTQSYRGTVRGRTILLDEETPLTEGAAVLVMPVADSPGSPAAIIAAIEASPRVPAEWVDKLERMIAEGRRPKET